MGVGTARQILQLLKNERPEFMVHPEIWNTAGVFPSLPVSPRPYDPPPNDGLTIVKVEAFPTSFPVKEGVTLGIGRAVKRDCVIVKFTTENGLVGWGESHHGRCFGAIGQLINTTLRQLVTGMNAANVVGVWTRIYLRQLASHGMGTAAALAMSGIDLALWDIRGKAVGWPVYKLLGGVSKAIPACAGGISLGFQPAQELVAEAQELVAQGYRILKLRFGDTVKRDVERLDAIRVAFGDTIGIMVDANTGYRVEDARQVMPELVSNHVIWLEEPLPPQDYRSYELAGRFGGIPLAAGENHLARYEFNRVIEYVRQRHQYGCQHLSSAGPETPVF